MPGTEADRLSVGDLCSGRLGGRPARNEGGAWIPGRAQRGQEVHRRVEQRLLSEHAGARAEVELAWEGMLGDRAVRISGRADVLHPMGLAEEIKTVLADPAAFRRYRSEQFPGHCMQALLYSWLAGSGDRVYARLRLVNLIDDGEKLFRLESTPDEILGWIEVEYNRYRLAQEKLARLCGDRRLQAEELVFPYRELRPGQQDLVDRVETALKDDRITLLHAPTGLGKSISVLFPALRDALRRDGRVFFTTAKNTGREAALEAASAMNAAGAGIKAVAMSSRESMCLNDVYFCHEEHCPYLRNMEKGLPTAIEDLEDTPIVRAEQLQAAGRKHRVCPHEAALGLCETRDLVVGDYNYVFDPRIRIRRLFVEGDPSKLTVLVDEAHNLPARARGWFSQEITDGDLSSLRTLLKERSRTGDLFEAAPMERTQAKLDEALQRLEEIWADGPAWVGEGFRHGNQALAELPIERIEEAFSLYETAIVSYLFLRVMHAIVVPKDPVIQFYFELGRFVELLKRQGPAMHHIIRLDEGETGLQVLCSWAGDHLRECLSALRGAVLFSATLKPWDFQAGELGLAEEARLQQMEAASPFPASNRLLLAHTGVSTRYQDREFSLAELRNLCLGFFEAIRGNVAVFLPSFSYLRQLREEFPAGLALLAHEGAVEPQLRRAFIQRLQSGPPRLFLTVMGGIFAEAVDFPGRMLEGAIVVGPGLPQLSCERELARRYYDGQGENGFDLAYKLPGMQRVIQAAGRVIRTPTDRGALLFVDDRYLETDRRALLEEVYGETFACHDDSGTILEKVARFHSAPSAASGSSSDKNR